MLSDYPAKLYCIVAVFNREETTRRLLEQLRRQMLSNMCVIVVDDGSTDGTRAMLERFEGLDIQIIPGSGNLWWGGAMRLGMQTASAQMGVTDALILLNDDIEVDNDFLSRFYNRAQELGPRAAIGCAQRDVDDAVNLFVGYKIDYLTCRMDELAASGPHGVVHDVDALCGRGMLVSSEVVASAGYIDAKKFPHYLGDIEYSARIKDLGYRVVCDSNNIVCTSLVASDAPRVAKRPWRRFLSPTGSKNLLQHYRFWSSRGPRFLARTALIRFPFIKLSRALRHATRRR